MAALDVVIAVHDDQLREQCVDVVRHNSRFRLLTSSGDIADTRVDAQRADVVVVGGPSEVGTASAQSPSRATSLRRPLVLPVTHDDVPRPILELAAASDPLTDEHSRTTSLTLEMVERAIDADRPSLVLEPLVGRQDRRVIGVEALSRFPTGHRSTGPILVRRRAPRRGGCRPRTTAVRKVLRAGASLPLHVHVR